MSQMICCHIEYRLSDACGYSTFGHLYLDRDPLLLALLGGGPWGEAVAPLFALRGFPPDANMLTVMAWLLLISDQETSVRRTIPRAEAEKWVRSGVAHWVGNDQITDPDYFGPSWLSTAEMEQVHAEYQARTGQGLATVEALLGAMRPLPDARLVYWFGN